MPYTQYILMNHCSDFSIRVANGQKHQHSTNSKEESSLDAPFQVHYLL